MSVEKRDFYGKEVADAIKNACDTLHVPQEQLDIEVLETGSTGIFGLIRKKARIRVSLKIEEKTREEEPPPQENAQNHAPEVATQFEPEKASVMGDAEASDEEGGEDDEAEEEDEEESENALYRGSTQEEEGEASPEGVATVKSELGRMIELMGYPSGVEVSVSGISLHCAISGEYEEELSGPEGKTLDSIQYLLRKIAARKCAERLRINVDVGNFRQRRLTELKERAQVLAKQVKENGKTQVLPALNPSERREIHMVLQDDKEVRSRSVGDGLFKKILIYKPGKTAQAGRKKSPPRGRRGKPRNQRTKSSGEE